MLRSNLLPSAALLEAVGADRCTCPADDVTVARRLSGTGLSHGASAVSASRLPASPAGGSPRLGGATTMDRRVVGDYAAIGIAGAEAGVAGGRLLGAGEPGRSGLAGWQMAGLPAVGVPADVVTAAA